MSEPSPFREYALDAATKYIAGREGLLLKNRLALFRRAFRPILERIRSAEAILDVGCGAGELLHYLASATRAQLVGVDPSPSQIEIATARLHGFDNVQLVPDSTALQRRFDLVFSLHVIEHVPDPELAGFARGLAKLTSADGRIVVATPNGLNPLAYAYFMSTDKTHLRMHSPYTLSEIFRPAGFEIESVHRELPQAYDLWSFAKTIVWAASSLFLLLGVYATAGGVRGLRFPLSMAPSFYAVLRPCHPQSSGKELSDDPGTHRSATTAVTSSTDCSGPERRA